MRQVLSPAGRHHAARVAAHISTERRARPEHDVEFQRCTLIDFVVAAVQDATPRAIEHAEVVRRSLADQECFAQALLSLPEPVPALQRAFERGRRLLRYTE